MWLADSPILSDRLLDLAKDAGLSFATYRRVKEDLLRCKAGQWKGRWYTFLPEQLQTWELMRTQMAESGAWSVNPGSDAQATGSDAHLEHVISGPGGQMLIGDLIQTPSNGHSPESTFKHLISSDEHLTDPDAQMLIGAETTRARAGEDDLAAEQLDELYRDADVVALEAE